MRRDCRCSSAATVCRLFFTRRWISRIVASLVMSPRSRRRAFDTSRHSRTAPSRCPCSVSGTARSDSATPGLDVGPPRRAPHEHERHRLAGRALLQRSAVTSTSERPTSLPSAPEPAGSTTGRWGRRGPRPPKSRTSPSPTRGAPRRGPVGASVAGNLAARDHPEDLVGGLDVAGSSRRPACAPPRAHLPAITRRWHGRAARRGRPPRAPRRTRTSAARAKRCKAPAPRAPGATVAPPLGRERADDVVVVHGRAGRRAARCQIATKSSSSVGSHSTRSANARSDTTCQSPTSRWSHSRSATSSEAWRATSVLSVDTAPA